MEMQLVKFTAQNLKLAGRLTHFDECITHATVQIHNCDTSSFVFMYFFHGIIVKAASPTVLLLTTAEQTSYASLV